MEVGIETFLSLTDHTPIEKIFILERCFNLKYNNNIPEIYLVYYLSLKKLDLFLKKDDVFINNINAIHVTFSDYLSKTLN